MNTPLHLTDVAAQMMAVPSRYLGIWRRDWIERRQDGAARPLRDTRPAIWFQSGRCHVDLRIDHAFAALAAPGTPALPTQIAFAGRTEVRLQHGRELCRWWPAFAYPQLTGKVDAGFMTFESATHLMEHGVDGRYLESWRRINRDDELPRCLRFEAADDRAASCYLMLCGPYFALGANRGHPECPGLPVFAWGERVDGSAVWRVRECLAPWWVDRDVEVGSQLADLSRALPSDQREWDLPLLPAIGWHLTHID